MLQKWLLIAGYFTIFIVIIIYKEPILLWLQHESKDDLVLICIAAVLLALIPVIPYGLVAGVIGAKYGPYWGGLINVFCSTAAAALLFVMIRFLFQQQGRKLLTTFKASKQFTALIERHAFFSVLLARLLPFVPAAVVNSYTAISHVRFTVFVFATLLGKIPVMFLFAILGNQLLTNRSAMLWTVLVYLLFLVIVYTVYRRLQRYHMKEAN